MALRLWSAAFMISLLLNLVVYGLFGVQLISTDSKVLSFHLTNTIISLLRVTLLGILLHLVLVMRKLKSGMVDTLAIYTVVAAIMLPVATVLVFPDTILLEMKLKQLSQLGISDEEKLSHVIEVALNSAFAHKLFTEPAVNSLFMDQLANGFGIFKLIGILAALTLLMRAILHRHREEKFRLVDALGIWAVFCLPLSSVIFEPLRHLAIYQLIAR
jgi:hypothetical protein